jgi:DNA-binding CsgD family transcriptional regulator
MEFDQNASDNENNQNETSLTQVEKDILALIRKGLISKEIANIRNCSPRTIEKHRSNILKKLNLPSSQNALLVWIVQNPDRFDT